MTCSRTSPGVNSVYPLYRVNTMTHIAHRIARIVETAAPFPETKYTWYTYTSDRNTLISSKKSKAKVTLRNGSRFGLRAATSGAAQGSMRVVTDELGIAAVFTLSEENATELISRSTLELLNAENVDVDESQPGFSVDAEHDVKS